MSKDHTKKANVNSGIPASKQNLSSMEPTKEEDQECVSYWFRSSDDVQSGFVTGNTFDLKPVKYSVIDGKAFCEGDIYLGQAEEMARIARDAPDSSQVFVSGVAIRGDRFRWPNGIIPFVIDPNHNKKQLILDAMEHWASLTPIRFVERESGNSSHENYVSFEEHEGCWSAVGMRGGYQIVSIGQNCTFGSVVHEIGHVVGLWHEHGRQDRDNYIRILWENIEEGREHNFQQHITDGDDIGDYDYKSIMHYPALAFSKNGQPTIIPINGESIGQRLGLSKWDIEAVKAMYADSHNTGSTFNKPSEAQLVQLGSIGPFDCRRWITSDWPKEWSVIWNVIPSSLSTRVEWKIITERQSETLLRYYIEIRNLSGVQTDIEIKYIIL